MKRTLTNFRMRSYQAKERLSETLGVADVHLVKLEGLIVPSKFYGIAAGGLVESDSSSLFFWAMTSAAAFSCRSLWSKDGFVKLGHVLGVGLSCEL